MNDFSIKSLVDEELAWEPSLDAANIGVGVKDGVVTLMGHVDSYSEKLAAERAAQRVRGVRAIAEDLEVRFSGHVPSNDDEIALRAANVIDWDSSIPDGEVKIKVENGYVTLSGEVDWRYQANRARDHAAALSGVRGVTNLISVKPHVTPGDVKQRIEKALTRSAEIEAKAIKVKVLGGQVTLEGEVDAWHDRDVARQAAWAAPGVKSVVDHIRIGV
jgi:osmotically-inducible protein OsmY